MVAKGRVKVEIDRDVLAALWAKGLTGEQIGARLGCSESTAIARAKEYGLPARKVKRRIRKFVAKPAAVAVAAVKPPKPVEYSPEIFAAIARAKTSPTPVKALGVIATRFRLSPAIVRELARR